MANGMIVATDVAKGMALAKLATLRKTLIDYRGDPTKLFIATAYHEAGHAVVGYRFRKWIREDGITCDVDTPGVGQCHTRKEIPPPLKEVTDAPLAKMFERHLETECMEMLAGFAAEFRATGRKGSICCGEDADMAIGLIQYVRGCDRSQAEGELPYCELDTKRLVARPEIWTAIETVANALICAKGKLSSEAANALLESSGVVQVKPTYWWGTDVAWSQFVAALAPAADPRVR